MNSCLSCETHSMVDKPTRRVQDLSVVLCAFRLRVRTLKVELALHFHGLPTYRFNQPRDWVFLNLQMGNQGYRGSTVIRLANFQLHIGLELLTHVVQGLTVIHLRVISIQTIQINSLIVISLKKKQTCSSRWLTTEILISYRIICKLVKILVF